MSMVQLMVAKPRLEPFKRTLDSARQVLLRIEEWLESGQHPELDLESLWKNLDAAIRMAKNDPDHLEQVLEGVLDQIKPFVKATGWVVKP